MTLAGSNPIGATTTEIEVIGHHRLSVASSSLFQPWEDCVLEVSTDPRFVVVVVVDVVVVNAWSEHWPDHLMTVTSNSRVDSQRNEKPVTDVSR